MVSIVRAALREIFARIKFMQIPDGDYFVPPTVRHRSLQPSLSANFRADEERLGGKVTERWAKNGCGIASATTVVDSILRTRDPSIKLESVTFLCEEYEDSAYIQDVGWSHRGLVKFATDHAVHAFNEPYEHKYAICARILEGWIPVASVTLNFQGGKEYTDNNGNDSKKPRGGHLVVLVGFRKTGSKITGLFVDDCYNETLRDDEISNEYIVIDAFHKSYSGKVIYFRS